MKHIIGSALGLTADHFDGKKRGIMISGEPYIYCSAPDNDHCEFVEKMYGTPWFLSSGFGRVFNHEVDIPIRDFLQGRGAVKEIVVRHVRDRSMTFGWWLADFPVASSRIGSAY